MVSLCTVWKANITGTLILQIAGSKGTSGDTNTSTDDTTDTSNSCTTTTNSGELKVSPNHKFSIYQGNCIACWL